MAADTTMSEDGIDTEVAFDVYVEFSGNIRVKARTAEEARAKIDRMAEQEVFNHIKGNLEVAWPLMVRESK